MTPKEQSLLRIAEALEKIVGKLDQISYNQHETVAAPVITQTGNTVAITCATEGAAIHYTTDLKEPTQESDVYTEEIDITMNTTFKAKAFKLDMNDSAITTEECIYEDLEDES